MTAEPHARRRPLRAADPHLPHRRHPGLHGLHPGGRGRGGGPARERFSPSLSARASKPAVATSSSSAATRRWRSSPRRGRPSARRRSSRRSSPTRRRATPSLPLRVGIGLDAGEAVPFEGGYRGAALNLAARLCCRRGRRDDRQRGGGPPGPGARRDPTWHNGQPLEAKGIDQPVRRSTSGLPSPGSVIGPAPSRTDAPPVLDPATPRSARRGRAGRPLGLAPGPSWRGPRHPAHRSTRHGQDPPGGRGRDRRVA